MIKQENQGSTCLANFKFNYDRFKIVSMVERLELMLAMESRRKFLAAGLP